MIKLLHVEDDADIREIASMALSLSDEINLMQCDSGEAALAALEGFDPDILLLDMMMPGMTGRQTLEHVRAVPAYHEIPAIFMTARAQHAEIEELLANGAAEVISKPFDPMQLADQILAAAKKAAVSG